MALHGPAWAAPRSRERRRRLQTNVDFAALVRRVVSLEPRVAADAALETGGGIRVRWRRSGRDLLIEVEDDGPGIAHTENPFVPLFTTKEGGSGIGLVLARQIIEAHGGSLQMANREGGRGALALVRVPNGT